ncbi:MAG: hypothetical protein NT149_00795 [Candidatus Gottesmanbacteria bacterium]|nr:hypothetical protein [Candidatus Gottesmanbacteria bacterium]
MTDQQIIDQLKDHEKRIHELESRVNSRTTLSEVHVKATKDISFAGPKGGILLLINEDFFKTKRTVDVVAAELNKRGYVYKRDVFQTALNRLAVSKGPLVKFEEAGKKVYAERK